MASNYTPFEIVITAIICKGDKYLIARRSMQKKKFPGMWTVPGGHLETSDYTSQPKDTENYWYNILEKALERELKEEVRLEVENVRYLTSLAMEPKSEGVASIVISCLADYTSGEVKLEDGENDKFEWVTSEEAKGYELIDGILDELLMADALIKGEKYIWKRH